MLTHRWSAVLAVAVAAGFLVYTIKRSRDADVVG
jgi:hypothetical protein